MLKLLVGVGGIVNSPSSFTTLLDEVSLFYFTFHALPCF
jgi:hypothetical protein